MDDRGTGRTWRQMAALSDGDTFIVAHRGERAHCRHMLTKMNRRHDALNLVILEDAHAAVRSLASTARWDIDHFAADTMTAEQAALLAPYRRLHPMPICSCPQIVGRDMSVLDVTREPCALHPSRYL